MKKIIFIILTLVILSSFKAYAFDNRFLQMRNKIFEESKEIKLLLVKSKDLILLNSMWDSSIMTLTQLDAYFSMVGIFNTVKKEKVNQAAIDYLSNWLNGIKKTNELNVKGLNALTQIFEAKTKVHVEKLKGYYGELNNQINTELEKISYLKKSLIK
jgi:hypothetical protein